MEPVVVGWVVRVADGRLQSDCVLGPGLAVFACLTFATPSMFARRAGLAMWTFMSIKTLYIVSSPLSLSLSHTHSPQQLYSNSWKAMHSG